jgi:hypothetical protein
MTVQKLVRAERNDGTIRSISILVRAGAVSAMASVPASSIEAVVEPDEADRAPEAMDATITPARGVPNPTTTVDAPRDARHVPPATVRRVTSVAAAEPVFRGGRLTTARSVSLARAGRQPAVTTPVQGVATVPRRDPAAAGDPPRDDDRVAEPSPQHSAAAQRPLHRVLRRHVQEVASAQPAISAVDSAGHVPSSLEPPAAQLSARGSLAPGPIEPTSPRAHPAGGPPRPTQVVRPQPDAHRNATPMPPRATVNAMEPRSRRDADGVRDTQQPLPRVSPPMRPAPSASGQPAPVSLTASGHDAHARDVDVTKLSTAEQRPRTAEARAATPHVPDVAASHLPHGAAPGVPGAVPQHRRRPVAPPPPDATELHRRMTDQHTAAEVVEPVHDPAAGSPAVGASAPIARGGAVVPRTGRLGRPLRQLPATASPVPPRSRMPDAVEALAIRSEQPATGAASAATGAASLDGSAVGADTDRRIVASGREGERVLDAAARQGALARPALDESSTPYVASPVDDAGRVGSVHDGVRSIAVVDIAAPRRPPNARHNVALALPPPAAPVSLEPAPPAVTRAVGRVMGDDFSKVPIRRDAESERDAAQLGARAFTRHGEVHLPPRQGPLREPRAAALLAHELTHVAQQRRSPLDPPTEGSPQGRRFEAEALAVEHRVMRGSRSKVSPAAHAAPAVAPLRSASAERPVPSRSAPAAPPPVPAPRAGVQRAPLDGLAANDLEPAAADAERLDLDDLARRLFGRLRSALRDELLLDRERAGLAVDRW